ncbi:FAD-dependent thymidylate synthase [Desulfurobacterium indicum]|uniref:FAD-dependent thymidylate synthase n=1 Tax=Desulfurobacterium indicum TaxID=1914305 RepID=A0A1R1MLE6_9BACT|nr:FAD-dependent thymidylate synthase [Desulfurobacterium indicum]OMH40583.1 thymidylate synthase, flavin-dependent [Desulfurobacterium indicum]
MRIILLDANIPDLDIEERELEKHIFFTFLVDGISRACSHQLVRHRPASYSQQSQRYVSMKDFPYVKPESLKDKFILYENKKISFDDVMSFLGDVYEAFIEAGVPKEDARFVLPNACATRIVFTMNSKELIHFLKLRTCNRAQWEIREMAIRMLKLLREKMPEIFDRVGPGCFMTGVCPEGGKTCGKQPEVVSFFENL